MGASVILNEDTHTHTHTCIYIYIYTHAHIIIYISKYIEYAIVTNCKVEGEVFEDVNELEIEGPPSVLTLVTQKPDITFLKMQLSCMPKTQQKSCSIFDGAKQFHKEQILDNSISLSLSIITSIVTPFINNCKDPFFSWRCLKREELKKYDFLLI